MRRAASKLRRGIGPRLFESLDFGSQIVNLVAQAAQFLTKPMKLFHQFRHRRMVGTLHPVFAGSQFSLDYFGLVIETLHLIVHSQMLEMFTGLTQMFQAVSQIVIFSALSAMMIQGACRSTSADLRVPGPFDRLSSTGVRSIGGTVSPLHHLPRASGAVGRPFEVRGEWGRFLGSGLLDGGPRWPKLRFCLGFVDRAGLVRRRQFAIDSFCDFAELLRRGGGTVSLENVRLPGQFLNSGFLRPSVICHTWECVDVQ